MTVYRGIHDFTTADTIRFWSAVERTDPDDCWEWSARRNPGGYGVFDIHGGTWKAHRLAVALTHWEDPALNVLHTCDNPPCVNPNHMFLGTTLANNVDCALKGRRAASRLTEQQVRAIRADGRPAVDIALEYNVAASAVFRVLANKTHFDPNYDPASRPPRRNAAAEAQMMKTHCPKGHPYAGENLIVATNGSRHCRECSLASRRASRRRVNA